MKWLVLLHVLGATIWAGGHLILSIGFLPKALKEKDIGIILDFEKQYEQIGIPALLLQLITGFWMATVYVPFSDWLSLSTPHHAYLWIKIALLVSTIGFAVHARIFIIPNLTIEKLPSLAFHIIMATVLAVSFVITGLSFRFTYL
jgi:putative copper export protein